MTRPKLVVVHPEPDKQHGGRDGKKYRFELSRKRLIFYAFSSAVALCWMFVMGVLVGRGIALVSAEDVSLRAEFIRFLGLGKEPEQPVQKAAETWGDPKKMLESLTYYEDLTNQGTPPGTAVPKPVAEQPAPASPPAAPASTSAAPADEPAVKRPVPQAPATAPTPPEKATPQEAKSAKAAASPPGDTIAPAEHFTLLVASLKDPDNAQRLVDQLTSKGYTPRLEALDLHGGGRWNRVLVGSFQSRDAALKFAADFNRKENMEGLVIRESAQ